MIALGRGVVKVWIGIAHLLGSMVRGIGHGARDLDPEHRRDGAGLFLIGLAVVVAAAIWWDLPGAVGNGIRTVVGGSVGMLGWAVPLMLLFIAMRTLRHPDRNGPAGRQVIGWTAVCPRRTRPGPHRQRSAPSEQPGRRHRCRTPAARSGTSSPSLLSDLLTQYVAAPLLVLLSIFGALVVTGTPVYAIPLRFRAAFDVLMGRTALPEDAPSVVAAPTDDTVRLTRKERRAKAALEDDGEPTVKPYDSPVLEGREISKRGRKSKAARGPEEDAYDVDADAAAAAGARVSASPPVPAAVPASRKRRPSRRRTRRSRSGSSSSACPATSRTRCPTGRCSSRVRCTRRGPRRPTRWSTG